VLSFGLCGWLSAPGSALAVRLRLFGYRLFGYRLLGNWLFGY